MPAHLDEPIATSPVDPLSFRVRGWIALDPAEGAISRLEAWAGDVRLGHTAARYERPDVNAALGLPAGSPTGFELFAHHPGELAGRSFEVTLHARMTDGRLTPVLARATATAIARDYRRNHFGVLLDAGTTAVQREENIFATGPSQAEGSPEVATLLRRHLPPPPSRILDVGCGLGPYARGLMAAGHAWMGAEIDPADCAGLARLGLPHRQVDGRTLPFADGSFEAAICIEVLEHIDEPRAFLREVSRVAPGRLIVSVPNCELLGYLADHLATPWHMLESTHVNYFTRWSLGALLREFYADVELGFHTPYPLRSPDGTPLHYHLLAVARS